MQKKNVQFMISNANVWKVENGEEMCWPRDRYYSTITFHNDIELRMWICWLYPWLQSHVHDAHFSNIKCKHLGTETSVLRLYHSCLMNGFVSSIFIRRLVCSPFLFFYVLIFFLSHSNSNVDDDEHSMENGTLCKLSSSIMLTEHCEHCKHCWSNCIDKNLFYQFDK